MHDALYSIAPNGPFLPHLVDAILNGPLLNSPLLGDWTRDNPFWLADVTIILPTRRARLALSSAFADALGGAALLPDIRTLGVEEDDEALFLEPGASPAQGKAIGDTDRRFLLCQLIEKWLSQNKSSGHFGNLEGMTHPARILSLADSLAHLIDEMHIEGIEPDAIRAVPPFELNPENTQDLNTNFQLNLNFLEIVLSQWPKILADINRIDASRLKILRVEQHGGNLTQLFGNRPVIAAGSTGSVPATARLLASILKLPRGALVLPGLDTNLTKQNHQDLLDLKIAPHGHSQYGLAQLLSSLKKTHTDVQELVSTSSNRRTHIVRHALALAKDTSKWNTTRAKFSDVEMENATNGLAIVGAKSDQEQALVVALAARDAIADNKTVGIITPDRNFARRVSVELRRFDIEIDDSAGMPLFHAPAGRLVRQILRLGLLDFSPVDLMAMLRNANVTMGQNRTEISQLAQWIELALLRGQHPGTGTEGLRKILAQNLAGDLPHVALNLTQNMGNTIEQFLNNLDVQFAPLMTLLQKENFSSAALTQTLNTVFLSLTRKLDGQTSLPGYADMRLWVQSISATSQPGPALSKSNAETVLQALMANVSVRTQRPVRDDIAIWGRLEARLQSADLIIMANLNEGTWPEVADPGPWLSRSMRLHAGLEPPERQQGQAAHDFEMAIGNENVLMTYSHRSGAAPALVSRLLERFYAFVGDVSTRKMHQRGEHYLALARALDKTGAPKPAIRPAPCPPAPLRPRSLSITEIETLFRSPFDLYAKYTLGLHALDPLGNEISHRERGNLVHEVFATFVEQGHDPNASNAEVIMGEIARDVFCVLEHRPEQRDIWLRRLERSVEGFLEFERNRSEQIKSRFAEIDLSWRFEVEGQDFHLRGRADRIDLGEDGTFEILDFKTGSIPTPVEMNNFLAPQLLVTAAIAKALGFKGATPATTSALAYIKIGAGPAAFEYQAFKLPPDTDANQAADTIMQMIHRHISAFLLSDTTIMSPRIMPKASQSFTGNFDHFARTDEWSQSELGDSET